MENSVGALLQAAATRYKEKVALIFGEEEWSFSALEAAASKVCAWLQVQGVGPGSTVGLYSPNSPEWVIAYYGVMKAGAVVVPLNLMLTAEEALYALNDCGAVAVFASADRIARIAPLRGESDVRHWIAFGAETPSGAIGFSALLSGGSDRLATPSIDIDQPCTIGYTSGTTGHPKGAVLSHRSILMNTAMTATMHVRTSADTVVSALPCSHVYGNIVMNAAIAYGMTLVLHQVFDVERVLQSVQQHRATMLEGVPTMYMYILNDARLNQFDLTSLTRCIVGGQTMPEAKMRAVEAAFGCPLIELWGMTELGGLGTTHSAYGPTRHGSIGVPLPHLEARVVATDGSERVLPADEVGELHIRGPVTMREYLGRPDETSRTLDAAGWLRTGDLVRQDANGYLYVVDRLKDMVITGGFNVYPAELERVIAEHPAVAMVAVGAILDENKGELAKAYIVPKLGTDLDLLDVERHCRQKLAAYKVPRAFQIVTDLPKTSTGKILRRMLRSLDPKN